MVLDGVVDPNLSGEDFAKDQALGLEGALQRFFAYCRSVGCIAGGIDPSTALDTVIAQAKTEPTASNAGHQATPIDVYNALLQAMYSSGAWPNFASYINQALSGDDSQIVGLAQAYTQPQANGTYDNWSEVSVAVNCLDRDFPRSPTPSGSSPRTSATSRRISARRSPRVTAAALFGRRRLSLCMLGPPRLRLPSS